MEFYSKLVLLDSWLKNSSGKRTHLCFLSNDWVLVFHVEILNHTLLKMCLCAHVCGGGGMCTERTALVVIPKTSFVFETGYFIGLELSV